MLIPILLFLLGLILLIKGGDWFVEGGVGIAHHFHVPELLIGATIVSIGTTLPEVMVSAISAVGGHGEMAYGNAIGSIICNTALIAALTVAIRPSKVDKRTFIVPVIFFFIAAAFYMLTAYHVGYFSRMTGILLLVLFAAYMLYTVIQIKNTMPKRQENAESKLGISLIRLFLGAVLIVIGARLLVDNGIKLASGFGVPESVIALTFVAIGTSLPEFVTAVTSLIKGHGALGLGNIVGANFFNIALVSGVATTLSPFSVPQDKMVAGINASLVVSLPLMVVTMAILTVPALLSGKLLRLQGVILLLLYAGFCVFQFA